jgi:YidC/Oxa1 family membrane protein insertase
VNLWQDWLTIIWHTLAFCAVHLHLGMGLAIILTTLVMRLVFLPLTWTIARRADQRRKSLQRLQPELDRIKERFAGDQQRCAQETMKLYRREGVSFVDRTSLFGTLVQFPVFLGVYQVLRRIPRAGHFLWITNLARPDLWLAIIAGAATMALMATNSEFPEHLRLILIFVPALLTMIAALKFSAALSLYWTTTNAFSSAQTLVLRTVLNRQERVTRQR